MSITFQHKVGQHGNQLFVCIFAAIIARLNGLRIRIPTNGLVRFKDTPLDWIEPPDGTSRVVVRNLSDDITPSEHYHLARGYYQHTDNFNPYVDMIKNNILDLPTIQKNTNDVVLHIRLDGFNHNGHNSHIINPEWYKAILDTLEFEKLYIVMDTKSGRIWRKQSGDKKKYLDAFSGYNHEIISGTAEEDFNFIRSFDTIICSNSTFSFWATFLSDASRRFMPPFWESRSAKLSHIENAIVVEDNYGYINIETMEPVKITYQ
tara:strand:- start:3889 stop:4674 length:786 start_codon:yes stop_codon:yes gene_type:complete